MIAALAIGAPISRGSREQAHYLKAVGQAARDVSKIYGFVETT